MISERSCLGKNTEIVEVSFSIWCYCWNVSVCVDSHKFIKAGVIVDDWFCLFVENFQSFDDWLFIVIWSATGFSSFNESSFELFLGTIKEDDRFDIDMFRHYFFPFVHIFLTSWETVKKISSSIVISFNLLFKDSDHELTRDQFTLFDDGIDLLT